MNKVNIKLNKMFIECKYPKNLLFNDMSKLISIQRNTMDIFNAYDYDKNANAFNLSNPEERIISLIEDSRYSFDIDEPTSPEFFKNNSTKFAETVNNILDIDEMSRVGIRAFWGVEVDTLQIASDMIKKEFL